MRRGAARPGSRVRLRAREREAMCIAALRVGKTYDEIAADVGYASRSGAYAACMRALRNLPVPEVKELRKLHNERYEHLWAALQKNVDRGSAFAIQVAAGVVAAQSKLNGLEVCRKSN
jgi:hypothetical protein